MKKLIKYATIAVLLWFSIHIFLIVIDGLNDDLETVDVGVVLGNKVELDGQPSKRLQRRLDRAIELYEGDYLKYIIVSGGIGKEGFDEAVVMKDYLIQSGIPEDNIILDSKGNNTYMTAKNSKEIIEKESFNSVMIISQYYHISRTKLAFKKVGFNKVYSAHARIFEIRDIYSLVREFVAYYKYLVN
ncbi:YdcF family protein [Sporosalibacterium faouarense]|uniref:YdcF family protein n=1 Tax=Sporosalibacterium faouarense TaxID=516123 RepID=UPI001A9CA168|nr:YdcF family protein [Sporosalibacterium faouarense]